MFACTHRPYLQCRLSCLYRFASRRIHGSQTLIKPLEVFMLKWAIIFAIISLIAGVFGFTGVAAGAASIAKLLFFIFLVIAVIFIVLAILGIGAVS